MKRIEANRSYRELQLVKVCRGGREGKGKEERREGEREGEQRRKREEREGGREGGRKRGEREEGRGEREGGGGGEGGCKEWKECVVEIGDTTTNYRSNGCCEYLYA